jgi:hypothetical protein
MTRKFDARGNQRCFVVRILLNLVHSVRDGVRGTPRVVRDDTLSSIDLSRDRDLNGAERRRNPKDKKTEEVQVVGSPQFRVHCD